MIRYELHTRPHPFALPNKDNQTSIYRLIYKNVYSEAHGPTYLLLRYSVGVYITNTQALTSVLIKAPSLITISLTHVGLINLIKLANMLILAF